MSFYDTSEKSRQIQTVKLWHWFKSNNDTGQHLEFSRCLAIENNQFLVKLIVRSKSLTSQKTHAIQGPNTTSTFAFAKQSVIRFFFNRVRVRSMAALVRDWLTDSLTHSWLVDLIDVNLACDDGNSKPVEVLTVAEKHADDSLVQIWKMDFGHKAKFLFRL